MCSGMHAAVVRSSTSRHHGSERIAMTCSRAFAAWRMPLLAAFFGLLLAACSGGGDSFSFSSNNTRLVAVSFIGYPLAPPAPPATTAQPPPPTWLDEAPRFTFDGPI